MIFSYNKKFLYVYMLLFLCAINFGGIGIYVCPIFLLFLLLEPWKNINSQICVSVDIFYILLYSFVFSIGRLFWSNYNKRNIIIEGIFLIVYYCIGYNLTNRKIQNNSRQVIISLAIGGLLYGSLNVYMQKYNVLSIYYSQGYLARVCRDLWTGDILYATVNAQYFICIISLLGAELFIIRGREKWIILIFNIISIYSILKIQSRTMLYLIVLEVIFVFFFCFFYNLRYTTTIKKNLKYIVFFLIGICLVFFIWNENMYNIRDYILESNLYSRLLNEKSGLNNLGSRTEIHKYYFKNIINYPFGGIPAYLELPSSHNMILESAKYGGWLGLIIYLIIMFRSIKSLGILLKYKNIDIEDRVVFACSFLGYFICFMMEAPQSSNVGQFFIFFLLMGMIKGRVNQSARNFG